MKRVLKSLGMLTVTVVLMAAALPAFAVENPAANMTADECTVKDARWDTRMTSDRLTIGAAMFIANGYNAKWSRWCQKKVTIDVEGDRLQMLTDLEVIGGSSGFTLEGARMVTLDAKQLAGKGLSCAVRVEGTGVTLNNLRVVNVPTDMTAICVNKLNAKLEAVEVTNGKNGVVFKDGVTGGEIAWNASIEIDGDGFAIDLGSSEGSLNSNKIVPISDSDSVAETNDDGVIPVTDRTKAIMISAPKIEQYVDGGAGVGVCLKEARVVAAGTHKGQIKVWGFVTDSDGQTLSEDVVRLQIIDAEGFRGYVGPYNKDARVGMGSTTLVGGTATAKTGFFKFYLDQDVNLSEIVLIPEDVGHNAGTPSKPIKLVGGSSGDCADRTPGVEWSDSDDITGSSGLRFWNKPMCKTVRGIGEAGDVGDSAPGFDTDLDGLYDDEEDTNFNCECDAGETCWFRLDSDFDGIPDNAGDEKACETKNADGYTCASVGKYDADDDGIPNALDTDSDGDGRPDYLEDRDAAIVYTSGEEPNIGLLYEYQTSASFNTIKINGKSQTCLLEKGRKAGVAYIWYDVTRDASSGRITAVANPGDMPQGSDTPVLGTPVPEILMCRLSTLDSTQSFNGVYETDNNETDAYGQGGENTKSGVDSDNDGVCDGDNSGGKCTGKTKYMNDQCPTADGKGAVDGCSGVMPCRAGLVFKTTDPEYVIREDSNDPGSEPMGIDTEKLFKLDYKAIAKKCGDYDKDGIPDCVEGPKGEANCVDAETGLDYSKRDTDGDADGEKEYDGVGVGSTGQSDRCPTMAGDCDDGEARSFYVVRPVLGCFLDRDGDTLRDCEEDADGVYKPTPNLGMPITAELMETLESDPLDRDSDEDGLEDQVERLNPVNKLGYFTNPTNADTDSDGTSDRLEDRNNDGKFTLGEVESQGCSPAMLELDTDPTLADTDGDGISDTTELEVTGSVPDEASFSQQILNDAAIRSGIDLMSNPRSKDSDSDGLSDLQEYGIDGKVGFYDANPCMKDSDKDGIVDQDEYVGCALNASPTCKGDSGKMKDKQGESDTSNGIDRDSDGLSDECEAQLGSDPANNDTDGDGLLDGEEESGDCVYTPGKLRPDSEFKYETNALDADTDDDGMNDYLEMGVGKYGTDPTIADSDGDCITDGLEDANGNGKWDAGETNALSADTDEDGLPDGMLRGVGEDMNCNGLRDTDTNGSWLETDPTNPDSDFDGQSDFTEMNAGGWNIANLPGAVSGAGEGCSLGGGSAAPTSMIYLLGMLLAVTRAVGRRMRKEGMK